MGLGTRSLARPLSLRDIGALRDLFGDAEEGLRPSAFHMAWNVDGTGATAGGLQGPLPEHPARRTITLLQRKDEPLGRRLGRSTGWILRSRQLERHDVARPHRHVAVELDAAAAIHEATRLALAV
jgi:hypothetical protein